MAFVQRFLDFTFVLGEGAFGEGGQNTVKLSGLRATTRIKNAGGRAPGEIQAQIFGMTLSQMNALSTLGMIATTKRKNTITVEAGDAGSAPAVVFQGTFVNAWPDLNENPQNVSMVVLAQTGLFNAFKPALPTSISGAGDVATMLLGLANQMGIPFENSGVSAKLSNPYYGGTPLQQAKAIVRDAGIEWNFCDRNVLAIWPANGFRGGLIPKVSADTGMIGYPSFNANGIFVRSLFNPNFALGTRIEVVSRFINLPTSVWTIYKIDYALDAQVPKGLWECEIMAQPSNVTGLRTP